MPSILNPGSATDNASFTGAADGALTLQTGPSGAKINALAFDASGNATFAGTVSGTINPSNSLSFRNRIINGAMVIDQRNAGAAFSPTGNGYGSCDRWASVPSSSVWTIQQVSTGNSDFPYALRLKRNAAASASTLLVGQVIETNNCQDMSGQAVTLSFYVTAGANYSGTFNTEIWTGTGTNQGWVSLGSATWTGQTLAASNALVPTTTRTRYSYTATLSASVAEVALRFTYSATGTAGAADYVDITGVQLEKGSVATSFEHRPIGTELSLCQRYYQKFGAQFSAGACVGAGIALNATSSNTYLKYTTPMRAASTTTQSGCVIQYGSGTTTNITGVNSINCGGDSVLVQYSHSGGGPSAGNAVTVIANTTAAFVDFSAEL